MVSTESFGVGSEEPPSFLLQEKRIVMKAIHNNHFLNFRKGK
jgi:hypothetical protein